MPTIYDVARLASVSPATVSRVLNDRGDVDATLAARVREAVKMLGYRPNIVARNLRRQVADVWALIISDIENPHFTSMVRGVEDVAQANGHSVVLCNSDEELAKESRYVEVAVAERMAGVLISPASDRDTAVGPLLDRGIPVVCLDRKLRKSPIDAVLVDNRRGAEEATSHLLKSGYRRVACVTGPLRTSTGAQRLAGYRKALTAGGVEVDPALIRVADYKEAGGYEAVRSLLDSGERPDALFIANGLMTMGALQCLADEGVQTPDEIGIVGFDDPPWARLMRPAVSAVAQPTYEIGRRAAQLLVDRAGAKTAPARTITLSASLIVRDSSRR
jgi:LacI family transcriptional regulator